MRIERSVTAVAVAITMLVLVGVVRGRAPTAPATAQSGIVTDNDFSAVSVEYAVSDLQQSVAFFEKLGFTKKWENAGGGKPRAGLVGGNARIWLRQGAKPIQPGVGEALVRFWIDGGRAALVRYREAIQVRGITVLESHEDATLTMFSVATPDGQRVGFFSLSR
jgi:catechol 2,3-dioxygenase-like lactoylglutathione lyase family enzyme